MFKLEKFLKDKECLSNKIDGRIKEIIESLDSKLPLSQKLQLFCHYLIVFASHFRKPILFDNQYIPINSISFLFNYSGSGKDTTINMIKKIFNEATKVIENRRYDLNNEQALEQYNMNKDKNSKVDDFIINLPPLEIGISTPEGLVYAIESNEKIQLGSINIISNEFMAELSRNMNILPMMSSIAEIYDLGNKTSKRVKDKALQSNELNNVFLSCLFTSSFNIIEDINIRNKLSSEFKGRFSRRSSITFNNKIYEEEKINDIDEWLNTMFNKKNNRNEIFTKYSDLFKILANNFIMNSKKFIDFDENALKLLYVYKQYCNLKGNSITDIDKVFSNLNMSNRWFKALKLSGALAIFGNRDTIKEEDIVIAINITEIINNDIFLFEEELNKAEYEILIDYFVNNDKTNIDIHTLLKANLISKRTLKLDLENLIRLANSKDKDGIYKLNDNVDMIEYYKMEDSVDFGISFIDCKDTISKNDRVKFMNQTMQYVRVSFDRIVNLLKKNFIYSIYEFKDGIRKSDNLINKTNLIIYDIDESDEDIETVHNNLSDINHIICTTSDRENIYKFRIIIPLDKYISIENNLYKKFLKMISDDYFPNLKIDLLPQSQIFYSYKDSVVYINQNAENLKVKDYINKLDEKQFIEYTPKQKQEMLKDPYNTFNFAYNTLEGFRHRNMVKAIAKAYHLNCSYDYIVNLIYDINDSFIDKLDEKNIQGLIKFADKLFEKED